MAPLAAVALAAAAGGGLAWIGYGRGTGRDGTRSLILLRAVALTLLFLLLADATCAVRPQHARPLVLLDGSLSMDAAGGAWPAARDSARHLGDVRTFGDGQDADSLPDRGTSELRPALAAAAASGRPVVVVTDGELDDGADLPSDLIRAARVLVIPRRPVPDVAVTDVAAPTRAALDDTIGISVTIGRRDTGADSATVTLAADRPLARRTIRFGAASSVGVTFSIAARMIGAGDHLLRTRVTAAGDQEPRDDERWILIHVAPTPGIVLLAAPPDWDSRQLYRTLRSVTDLPVRGFSRMGGRWWTMESLAPVTADAVTRAARGADLLIVKGDGSLAPSARRALWTWPSGESGPAPEGGDWYATAPGASPVAGAWTGVPFDSLPPLAEVAPGTMPAKGWIGLEARRDRRGAVRAGIVGSEVAGRRQLLVTADGLWRWPFAGGAAEEAYRSLMAASVAWLLGGTPVTQIRPARGVVPRGTPLIFLWTGGNVPGPVPVTLRGDAGTRTDTLRFDGAGRAELRLPVGQYHFQAAGAIGVVAVEPWSREWFPGPVTVTAHAGHLEAALSLRRSARDRLWIFALILASLAAEWTLRRRRGLR